MEYQVLKNLFRDRDKMVRLYCLRTAMRDNLPELAEFVREGLRDERPDVIQTAIQAAKRVRDPEILGMVLTYLESPNSTLRGEAINALEGKSLPRVKEAIGDFLKREEDPNLLASGIKIIGSFGSEEYVPLLKAFLAYEDDRVRANAVEALARINTPEVAEILKALVIDRNNRVRANAIKALWDRGIRYGLNTIPDELRSPNSKKRASVAYILGEIREERSLDLLVGLLSDISQVVRNRAVLSLGKIGSTRVIGHLLSAYSKEEEPGVRENIIITCMQINPELTLARLSERCVSEEDARIRANMVKNLGATKNPKSVVFLTKALKDFDGRVRANAVDALSELKDQALIDLIIPMLHDSNNRVRSNAALALWKIGGTAAILTLKQMLRSSHKQMRASAAWALGEISALQFIDLLQDLSNDPDPDVRKCSLKALAKVSKIA
jgi:HEAT repeat protein